MVGCRRMHSETEHCQEWEVTLNGRMEASGTFVFFAISVLATCLSAPPCWTATISHSLAICTTKSGTVCPCAAKLEATLLTYASRDVEGSVQVPVYLTVTQNLVTGFPDTPLLNFAPQGFLS